MTSPASIAPTGVLLCFFLLAGASGCMTRFSVKMNNWIGHPIQQWLDIPDKGGAYVEEIRGPDENGNRIYVTYIRPRCRAFRTVDAEGIITGWTSESSGCKRYIN